MASRAADVGWLVVALVALGSGGIIGQSWREQSVTGPPGNKDENEVESRDAERKSAYRTTEPQLVPKVVRLPARRRTLSDEAKVNLEAPAEMSAVRRALDVHLRDADLGQCMTGIEKNPIIISLRYTVSVGERELVATKPELISALAEARGCIEAHLPEHIVAKPVVAEKFGVRYVGHLSTWMAFHRDTDAGSE